jgi:hypothetical protein
MVYTWSQFNCISSSSALKQKHLVESEKDLVSTEKCFTLLSFDLTKEQIEEIVMKDESNIKTIRR